MASENRFGFEWQKYSQMEENYELQFQRWVFPLRPEDFKDKAVLDAGCGMGRNSWWALKWGARSVIAFDYDQRSVEAARHNLKEFSNAQVFFKSIYDIDWRGQFDLVFSIGVIHHLKDPKAAIKNLVNALKLGGQLLLWVYSFEGNEWLVRFIDPIRRRLTSRLPVRLVYFLSYFLSVPLWLFVKTLKGPTPYLKQLAAFKFWHIHSIVFDQLIPEVANYWTRSQVADLMEGVGLGQVRIYRPENDCGWTVIGVKEKV